MHSGSCSLTVWVLHFKQGIHSCPLAGLSAHILLQEHFTQSLAWTTASWSKNNDIKYNILWIIYDNTNQPDQPKAKSQKLLCFHHAHPVPTSGRAPKHPWEALAKLIDINARVRKLTNTHSESDVWYVTAHAGTLCADQQPAVPGIRK